MKNILKALPKIILAILALIAFLAIWSFYIEPRQIKVQHVTLKIPRWDKNLNGIRIAVIADIHAGSPFIDAEQLRKVVQKTNNEKPDLILLLGDYVIQGVRGGRFIEPEIIASELSALRARDGIAGILGNHDWWFDGERVRKALKDSGMTVLENSTIEIKHNKSSFLIAGLADLDTRKPDTKNFTANLPDNIPIILLSHNPDVFPDVDKKISLTLAGHTHGGQVRFPIYGSPVVPSRYKNRYAKGHIVENNKHLFVSCGIGTSIVPVRFNNMPEIVILTLESETNK